MTNLWENFSSDGWVESNRKKKQNGKFNHFCKEHQRASISNHAELLELIS